MALLKNVLGLDVGAHAIKAVEVRQSLRTFEVAGAGTTRTPDPAKPDSETPDAESPDPESPLAAALRELMRGNALSTEHVVAALRGDRISSRRLTLPFGDAKKIAAAIPFEVEEDIPFELADCLIDWEPIRSERTSSDVVAMVAPRSEVASVVTTLREAGCAPQTLEVEGLVLGNLATLFDLPGARLLVDLGHSKSTCCALVDGRAVAARTLPVGGRLLTQAIADDRSLDPASAERWKHEEAFLGTAAEDAMSRARGVVDRLAREILRTASAVEERLSANGDGPFEAITLIGGGALLSGIEAALSDRIGIPCERIGPVPVAGEESGPPLDPPELYAPALALALRGTAQSRTRTNFLQEEFAVRIDFSRYRRDFGSTAVFAGATLFLACVSFATSTWLDLRRANEVETAIDQIYVAAFPGSQVPDNAIAALRKAVAEADQRAEFLGVYPGNLSALDVLSEISKHIPKNLDVVFEEVNISRQSVRLRVFSKTFESADRLGAELAKFVPFVRTQIGSIENDPKRNGKRFTVTITLTSPEDAA